MLNITSVRFEGLPPYVMALLVLLAAASLVRYANYLRRVRYVPAPLPLVLRAFVLLVTVVLIAGPAVYYRAHVAAPRRIAFALDSSASMAVRDGGKNVRFVRATELMKMLTNSGIDGDKYYFSSKVSRNSQGPFGRRTDFERALATPGGQPASRFTDIVLLSDGRSTEPGQMLADPGVRVHAVAFGPEREMFNSGISAIEAPDFSFVGGRTQVAADYYYEAAGRRDKLTIALYENGRRIAEKNVTVTAGEGRGRVAFDFTPSSRGRTVIEVRTGAKSHEITNDDNSRYAFVEVAASEKTILYVDAPGWDARFLGAFLSGMEKIRTDMILIGPGGEVMKGGDRKRLLSGNDALLSGYRVVIVGNVADNLGRGFIASLERYVQNGGRLIITGGDRSILAGASSFLAGGTVDGKGVDGNEKGFDIKPTLAGLASTVVRFSPDQDANKEAWQYLPLVQVYNRVRLRGPATVMAEHPYSDCGGRRCPMIYTHPAGDGDVAVFAFSGLWRWRFRERDADLFNVMMSGLLDHFLKAAVRDRTELSVKKSDVTAGDTQIVYMRVPDGSNPPAIIISDRHGDVVARIKPKCYAGGLCEAGYRAATPGLFTASVSGMAKTVMPVSFSVSVAAREYARLAPDNDFLKNISNSTDGVFFTEKNGGHLADILTAKTAMVAVEKRFAPWTSPLVIAMLFAALLAEWIMRRRGGLV